MANKASFVFTMRPIILLFIGWLVAVNLFALVSLNRLNLETDTAYSWIHPADTRQEQSWNPVALHARWDSLWYLDIAQNGYSIPEDNTLANIVFFPLYPILLWVGGFLFAGNMILAGWVFSSLFLFLALLYLYKLTKEFYPSLNPYLPVVLLLIFPTAFFLNALYTESLFLFLSIVSFYYAKKRQYIIAGGAGILAGFTRITGVLLFIPLVWEYARRHNFNYKKLFCVQLLPILAIPLAPFSFFLFHYLKFGNFFLFLDIQRAWGRAFALNAEHFSFASPAALSNLLLDLLFVVIALACTFLVFRKFGFALGVYMASTLLVALSTGTLMSIGRYILVLFPLYLLIASVANAYIRYAWIGGSFLLFALYTLLFANSYWAG